jgi:Phosphotransferase enzyme family
MTPATAASARGGRAGSSDAERLRRCLERDAVPRMVGRRARVAQVRRTASRTATSYRSEIVSARLADGAELRFFLKDYGSSKRPRPEAARRRDRELAVYRRLVGDGELGTARYCGAVWDDRAALHWLLLELVVGTPLRHLELRFWIDAARWLARFQGRFAGSPPAPEAMPTLERHDARFFAAAAERARRSVSRYPVESRRRLERLLARYEGSIDLLAAEEPVLVHGHYEAANILVDVEGAARICPVDWELAALGSRLFDLASLCDGFEPPALHRIWDAYAEGAAEAGLPAAPPREELRRAVDRLRLFRVVAWLGGAAEKRYSPSGVEKLLERGESLAPAAGS